MTAKPEQIEQQQRRSAAVLAHKLILIGAALAVAAGAIVGAMD